MAVLPFPLIAVVLFLIFTALSAGLYQLFNNRSSIGRWCGCLLLGLGLDLMTCFLLREGIFPGIGRQLVMAQVLAFLVITISMQVLVIYHTGHQPWISGRLILALTLVPLAIAGLLLAGWNSLPSTLHSPSSGFGLDIHIFNGRLNPAEALFVLYAAFAAFFSAFLLLARLVNGKPPQFAVTVFLAALILALEAAGLAEIVGANPLANVSVLQLALAIATLPIIIVILRWRALDSIPISQKLFKDSMKDGYLIVDSQYAVTDFNPAITEFLGDTVSVQVGSRLFDILPELESRLGKGGAEFSGQPFPFILKANERITEITVHPIGNPRTENLGKLLVMHNVTERDNLEDRLRRNNVELARSNNLLSTMTGCNIALQQVTGLEGILAVIDDVCDKLGLNSFVALQEDASGELAVRSFHAEQGQAKLLETLLTTRLIGYRLRRDRFATLYHALESRRILFQTDSRQAIELFLGSFPSWIIEPLKSGLIITGRRRSMAIPLTSADRLIGLITLWGSQLEASDGPHFQIFGSQIGWAVERAMLKEGEARHLAHLSRTTSLITTLATISSKLETAPESRLNLGILGDELRKIGLSCAVVTLDQDKEVATIRHISSADESISRIEGLAGFHLVDCKIPKRFWPGDRVTREGEPVWYDNPFEVFRGLFPRIPWQQAGADLDAIRQSITGRLCFLPLSFNDEVTGIMTIWGPGISDEDTATLSVFANQVAGVLRRNSVYESEIQKSSALTLELVQSKRREAIGKMAGRLAHEFNNLLSVMMGSIEVFLYDQPAKLPGRDLLEQAYRAGERGRDIVNQVMVYSSESNKLLEEVNILPVIRSGLFMLQAIIPSTVKLEKQLPAHCHLIFANAVQIEQVIINLCKNAIDALGERQGTIRITVDDVENPPGRPRESGDARHFIRLTVEDDGIGMLPETLNQIFDPFFTTKKIGKGTGLGLSVVQGIVNQHGGWITVASEYGKGSRFDVFLPASPGDERQQPAPEAELPGAPVRSDRAFRLLFVDADSAALRIPAIAFEKLGYGVQVLTSARGAFEGIVHGKIDCDLLLTALAMPDMDGGELCRKIRGLGMKIPAILMLEAGEFLEAGMMESLGIRAVLHKPVTLRQLMQSVQDALEEH